MTMEQNRTDLPIGRELDGWLQPPAPSRVRLCGDHCRVEPLDALRHADALHAANRLDRDGRNWTYLPYGPFPDLAAYRDWVSSAAAGEDPLFFAVTRSGAAGPAGVASYLQIRPDTGVIEVGHVHFSDALKGTAAATEALYLLIDNAFALGYRRLEWKCDALNAASRAAAQRLGFTFEGVFRQATVYKGRNRDSAWYAIIDGEWPALREAFRAWLAPDNFDNQGRQRQRLGSLTATALAGLRDGPAV